MHHNLKTWPAHFEAVLSGEKTFEIRDNSDRGFQKGDTVTLEEYDPKKIVGECSGRKLEKRITYVTGFAQQPGFVVFGIADVDAPISHETPAPYIAYSQGYVCGVNGGELRNPHPKGCAAWAAWHEGYSAGNKKGMELSMKRVKDASNLLTGTEEQS